jgi:CBS domain-containing protein
MPFIIQHLIPETQNLVTVTENDSAQRALSLMIEHDFSQLPVRDGNQKLKGMITSDSILRAVSNFKVTLENLRVFHAATKSRAYGEEDELFELLKGLRDISAVPIVNKQGIITAIVTSYDTAEYFRKRAEDIMLAEDIEVTLRDLIEGSHRNEIGEVDQDSLNRTIRSITSSNNDFRNRFKSALLSYIKTTSGQQPNPDNKVLGEVFTQYLEQPVTPKTFDELTLSDFIQIFKGLWERRTSDSQDLRWESVHHLLDDVRKTRNAIAHFREVTPQQREQLKFCADFLDRHQPEISIDPLTADLSNVASDEVTQAINVEFAHIGSDSVVLNKSSNFAPPEEEIEADDSRYAPLAIWLQAQEPDRVTRTFKDIEIIIEDELPPSARNNRSWWANDRVGHTQSIQWLEVGWRVSSVNMSAERVVFSRMEDRQKAYIDFFGQLQAKLQSIEALSITPQNNPQGKSWQSLAIKPTNHDPIKPSYINFSFARRSRFRIEIYIYEGEQSRTKQIFDQLQAQKTEIETEFGAAISWERLSHKSASRIGYYRSDSSITDSPEKLNEIQDWAVEILPKFYTALSDRFIAAQEQAISEEEH